MVPTPDGFVVAMNRDEQLIRLIGTPPRRMRTGRRWMVAPTEPAGGTWIGANDRGVVAALLNFYRHPSRDGRVSRGEIVPSLLSGSDIDSCLAAINRERIRRMNPFRAFLFCPGLNAARKIVWNGRTLRIRSLPWERSHWFSSGFDEPRASRARRSVCEAFGVDPADPQRALRMLHRSHKPVAGPFSICMHRADAATVSLTTVAIRPDCATMRYVSGAPCGKSRPAKIKMKCKFSQAPTTY